MHTVSAQAVLLAASADSLQVGWFVVAWFGGSCLSLLGYVEFEAVLLRCASQPWLLPFPFPSLLSLPCLFQTSISLPCCVSGVGLQPGLAWRGPELSILLPQPPEWLGLKGI